jgi:hypothetical protein
MSKTVTMAAFLSAAHIALVLAACIVLVLQTPIRSDAVMAEVQTASL